MTLGEWVLILVLVEHTLGAEEIGSLTALKCLNPCFSGTYSRSHMKLWLLAILLVLILVLVEHTLGVLDFASARSFSVGLNPCFSGTYSRRFLRLVYLKSRIKVLILVLVEHTLGDDSGLPVQH